MTVAGRALPEGRYGSRSRRRRRPLLWLLSVLAVAFGALVAYLAYANLGSAPIETQRVGFANLPDNSMRLTFDVLRDQPDRAAVCVVRVRGRDGAEGGRKEVLVPPGGSATSISTVIRSTSEPVTADVFGCSYHVPEYLSTAVRPSG